MDRLAALRRGHGSQMEADFLLGSALSSGARLNLAGWVLRVLCVGAVLALVATANPPWTPADLLMVVPVLGLALAALELEGDHADRWARRAGLLGWLGRHLADSRQYAMPSVPGVVENLLAPVVMLILLLGPSGRELSHTQSILGVALVATYTGLALAQVVTDQGYYNCDASRRPTRFLWLARFGVPVVAGLAGAGLVHLLVADPSPWLVVCLLLFMESAIIFGLVTDVVQGGALASYAMVNEQQLRSDRALLSAEVHRIKTSVRGQMQLAAEPRHRADLLRLLATVEELRARLDGDTLPTSVAQNLQVCARTARQEVGAVADISMSCAQGEEFLSTEGSEVMRHLVLDLTANAVLCGAQCVRVEVDLDLDSRPVVRVTVQVRDNGPGFRDTSTMKAPLPGSSRDRLASLCRLRRGTLSYSREDGWTRATATYRSSLAKGD